MKLNFLVAPDFAPDRLASLEFEHDRIDLGPADSVILATPWTQTAALVPDVPAPTGAAAILTVHFAGSFLNWIIRSPRPVVKSVRVSHRAVARYGFGTTVMLLSWSFATALSVPAPRIANEK